MRQNRTLLSGRCWLIKGKRSVDLGITQHRPESKVRLYAVIAATEEEFKGFLSDFALLAFGVTSES